MKSLKIPKGQSETVCRRRTDNTMAIRKSTKGRTTIDKTYIITSKMLRRHHDLVDRYGISVSQMTTDMFHLS
jgi:hypothetical protein